MVRAAGSTTGDRLHSTRRAQRRRAATAAMRRDCLRGEGDTGCSGGEDVATLSHLGSILTLMPDAEDEDGTVEEQVADHVVAEDEIADPRRVRSLVDHTPQAWKGRESVDPDCQPLGNA